MTTAKQTNPKAKKPTPKAKAKKASAPSSNAAPAATETKRERSPAMGKKLGVGKRMEELLREGKSTADVLAVIHAEFPLSRATGADVGIIRRKSGLSAKVSEKPTS